MKKETAHKAGQMLGAAMIAAMIGGLQYLFFDGLPAATAATLAGITPFIYHTIKTDLNK